MRVSKTVMRLCACVALIGVTIQTSKAQESRERLKFDGKERTYILRAPKEPGAGPLPLVVALHAYPAGAETMERVSGFTEFVESERLVVVYPDGIDGGFNALMCCGQEDDVGFIDALFRDIESRYPIDRRRVMATGISNGGDLAYRLAIELPGRFTAIAPVSAGLTADWIKKPAGNLPESPVSLLTFYGGRDKYRTMFQAGLEFWIERQACSRETSTGASGGIELVKGSCANGAVYESYFLPEMGHAWPGYTGEGRNAFPDSPLQATEMIVKFLKSLT